MAPSQLKQLKASLREKGVIGQQQSKKQRKQNAKSGAAAANRIHRNAVLQELREQFNPFEARAPARPAKFAVTTNKGNTDPVRHRPGVTRGLGEQRRKETLLKEIHSRNKTGMLLDRRFALSFDKELGDDFDEGDLRDSEDDSESGRNNKRKRLVEEDDMEGLAGQSDDEEQPERKKSKQEVMKEIIAKSKQYKYERQKAKEDDDDLRATLDQGLPSIFEMMRGIKAPEPPLQEQRPDPMMNPDRAALLNGKDRDAADKEYDQRLKQMAFDKRSQPADRTKTEEEIAEEEATRLRQLEKERLRRMHGEDDEGSADEGGADLDDDAEVDDAKPFGLHQLTTRPDLDVEDEDDFIIEDELVETGSALDLSFDDSDGSESAAEEDDDDDDDEFINGLTLRPGAESIPDDKKTLSTQDGSLAYTYPCPESHEEFLNIIKDVKMEDLPTVVQRIRALHHSRLHSDNKAKLGKFSRVLVEHVSYLANLREHPPFAILENLLRHIHSLAKTHPEDVAVAFRAQLRAVANDRPFNLLPSDLVILTGISTIFPTSDHFHPVVTPAMLSMGRYLGQGNIESLGDLVIGGYVTTLCLQYQALSKRYIPELVNYVLNALCILAPTAPKTKLGSLPARVPSEPMRLEGTDVSAEVRTPSFWDILTGSTVAKDRAEGLKLSLVETFTSILETAAELWATKSAFFEVFEPARAVLEHLIKSCAGKVPTALSDHMQRTCHNMNAQLAEARRARRPLLLHNHRPLAIKTAIPKFEESFNPDRHYDPDRERAELNKLKAEHKRERKGAMRELRKDANFIARESLREKRERDAEYERKYRRLIAEIQSEEGREANAYEREKKLRKGKR
uniref:Nucleolar protein 14 n=1 Tax=Coccidioides posadasii RMSCC 3488 TaxID=454284 RepID=A0A0J6F4R1_COCPO|nr:nucleolar protein 14 [Coccidioides posadasii RMSCC 3488]